MWLCVRRGLRSTEASAQSDLSRCCPLRFSVTNWTDIEEKIFKRKIVNIFWPIDFKIMSTNNICFGWEIRKLNFDTHSWLKSWVDSDQTGRMLRLIWVFARPNLIKNSKWVWAGNTTITNCRQHHGTARKSRSTITRHQEDKLRKAISSLFPIKIIAILEWT